MSTQANTGNQLSAEGKRAQLARLLREKAAREYTTSPLSYGQRALWFVYQLDRQSPAYNIMYAARVKRDFDREAFGRAFQAILNGHPVLRTAYGMDGGSPVQKVLAFQAFQLECVDARSLEWSELESRLQASADEPFDLEEGPVIRVQLFERDEEDHVLLVTAHHIALDFWSFDLLFDELEALYRQESSGADAGLTPSKYQYTDFVSWQQKLLEGPGGARLEEYWLEQLQGDLPDLDLRTDRSRPPVQSYEGKSFQFDLPDDLSRRLISLSKDQGATLYATMLAAFQTLLYRYSGQLDILVGSPTAGRSKVEFEGVLGYFLNPVVLRAGIEPDEPFAEFLARVRETLIGGIENQDYPFPLVVERLQPPRDPSRSPIFQVAFGWDKPRKVNEEQLTDGHSLGLRPFALGQQGAAFDLMLMMLNVGDSMSAALQYNSDLFDRATIERMVGHFQTLLASIVDNPQQALCNLPLFQATEQQELLGQWNETSADYPQDTCLHQLFEAQVERTPDSVAVECQGEQLTYAQLNEASGRLARQLTELGVEPDVLVGVCVERSVDMLVGLLGVLKAGGAYLPLAPDTPADRLTYMLQESKAPVVVTQRKLRETLPAYQGRIVLVDELPDATGTDGASEVAVSPEHLAYTIFTSGSTGKPKGVQIEHRSVVNFLESMRREPGIVAEDVLLAVTTLTFDISVLELFLPLSVGAKVIVVPHDVVADGTQLAEVMAKTGVTIMQATPATWRILVESGWEGDDNLKVLCGGEALPRDLADIVLELCDSMWNMYGPTETTIWSAIDEVSLADGPPPIGRPIANTQIYVLDSQMQPVPIGVTGDLYIGGDGLARGYLNNPELTFERFVDDPFSGAAGARLYKTGDLARYRPDGNIDFLGRSDFQVKVRGFRIELGEIEAALHEHPTVGQAVVTPRQAGSKIEDKRLVAYLTPIGDERPNVSLLRDYLRQSLPDYMVPAAFLWMDSFPLNPAGKVDRNALPDPDISRPELAAEFVAARNAGEEALAGIWASVLGLEQVGIHDNFFELGGASIQSLEVASLAKLEGLTMTPALLFQHPTIAELAVAVGAPTSEVAAAARSTAEEESRAAAARPLADPRDDAVETRKINTLIESLGVYLPPDEVTSKEVLDGCTNRIWFPLEKMTGIKSRRMAGKTEFSVDLARKAIDKCFDVSKYGPDDIDLVISCNIARMDEKEAVSIEPNTTMRLKKHFGFKNATVFDITNACTGMFTAIQVAQAYITTGLARRALVVSGEYITHITRTAQLEISGFMDPRLACLTVGDAGAAMVVEEAPSHDVGFHELEMYTLAKYSKMCIGCLTDQPHGGSIMHVPNPMEHTAVAVKHSVMHAEYMFEKSPWSPEEMDQLIMHQTSDRSLRDGKRAINKVYKSKICNDDNTINNLANRGNTATTSHMVAVWDNVLNGRIKSGDNVCFGITGSGQTIGTGIYTFDDLPDRIRDEAASVEREAPAVESPRPVPVSNMRVGIRSLGVATAEEGIVPETLPLSVTAAQRCLDEAGYDSSEIDLLIFAGVSRTGYISEPAIATMIADDLDMNCIIESEQERKTFAFDVYNGALGFLYACQAATQMLQSGLYRRAMVVVSEIEQNRTNFPDHSTGLREAASAVILEGATHGKTGFGAFEFGYFTEHFEARVGKGYYQEGKPFADIREADDIEQLYLDCIPQTVERLVKTEKLDLSKIRVLLPPQFSTSFNQKLAELLGVSSAHVVDLVVEGADLFTSACPFGYQFVRDKGLANPGDVALIVNVASGLQVGCTVYHF